MEYSIVYADPPWNYTATSNKIPSRAKEGQSYNAMRMIDIYDFKIPPTTKNCVLFMWATAPLLPEALYTIKSWGFEYKTIAFTWIKKNKCGSNFWGMGSWTRSNPEYCLLAIKGNPKSVSHSVHSVIETVIEEHSKKPGIVREKIVELCGDLPRIELFARQKIEGWDSVGNQLN
jgi:N6-adenosine-specific RNA methylase IME4